VTQDTISSKKICMTGTQL